MSNVPIKLEFSFCQFFQLHHNQQPSTNNITIHKNKTEA